MSKRKVLCAIVYRKIYLKCLYRELLNSTCRLGIWTTFPMIPWMYAPCFAGKAELREWESSPTELPVPALGFWTTGVWHWIKGKMLARALANGLCNRLPRETTRTVGLGATGRHASTEVCTELGSLKTSSYANVKQLKIKVFAKPLQQAKYNFNANFFFF